MCILCFLSGLSMESGSSSRSGMQPNSGRSGSAPSSFTARSSAGRLLLDLPVKNPLAFSRLGKPDRTKVRRLRCTRCATAASRLSAHPLRDAQFSHPSVYVATHDQTEPPRNQGAPARLACRARPAHFFLSASPERPACLSHLPSCLPACPPCLPARLFEAIELLCFRVQVALDSSGHLSLPRSSRGAHDHLSF